MGYKKYTYVFYNVKFAEYFKICAFHPRLGDFSEVPTLEVEADTPPPPPTGAPRSGPEPSLCFALGSPREVKLGFSALYSEAIGVWR